MGKAADLTRERIAAEALALLDEDGIAGMTMRRVARRLGVQAPSLYYHFQGQDDLIDAIHGLVDKEIDRAGLHEPDWRSGLAAFARSYHASFQRHPNVVALVSRRPVVAAEALSFYDELVQALVGHGLPVDDVLPVIGVLDFVVLGSAGETFTGGFHLRAADYVADYPHLARALQATDRGRADEIAFEMALHLWLDELGRRMGAGYRERSSTESAYTR